jgi:hypothetical protein
MLRAIVICAIVLGVVSTAAAGPTRDENVLKLPGGTLIAPEGFVWKKVHQEKMGGKTAVMYGATSKDTKATLILGIVPEKAENDEARVDAVKRYVEGTVASLKKAGAKNINLTPSVLRPPLTEKVDFSISFTGDRNDSSIVNGRVFFGKKTYLIQAVAESDQEAGALVRVTDALSE